jgi:hypothetical protein
MVAGTIGTVVVGEEDLIKNVYETRNVTAPSAPELRSIADFLAYLSPSVVGGAGCCGSTTIPVGILTSGWRWSEWGIDVQAGRST